MPLGFMCGSLTFLLTRPSRGATKITPEAMSALAISTHTPLAGRDTISGNTVSDAADFYSHAPRGARPLHLVVNPIAHPIF